MKDVKTYLEAVKEIENIIKRLENPDSLDIDKALAEFKEGVKLIKFCEDKLKSVDEEIGKILDN